ncbi:MAG: ABC-type multidrug transport system fused ATPase/permease subunit [Saprospiraceae bacterium]|jgi:ABC-type multidrug transport system fused ATPase/permease subunit
MALFTAVSIPAIIPFLQIIFDEELKVSEKPEVHSIEELVEYFKYLLSHSMEVNGKETTLIYMCVIIVVLYLLINLFRYISLFVMAPVRNGIVKDLRGQLFSKMLTMPLSYFSEERKGDLMSRITADVQEIESSILNVLQALFREPVIIIFCLGIMIYISAGLTLFVLGLIIFTAFLIGRIGKSLKRKSSKAQQKLGDLISIIEETLSGMRIIQGFTAESYQNERFEKENETYRKTLNKVIRRRDLSSPLSEFLGILIVAVLLWYASRQVFKNELDPSTLFGYLLAFFYILNPAKSFSKAYFNVQKGIAAVERVEEVLDAENIIKEDENARRIKDFHSKIEYRKVLFKYDKDDRNVLDNINIEISKGKVIALVGASGAGKSTIADLLPRFYDVKEGGVFIDGIDIREYNLRDLRAMMGIVSQEAILFNDTIYNNILFGLESVSEANVILAAKAANAHDFIIQTENGYQTNIGDRGNKLSGGQRQRLTIARAILKNPSILILDEATSALDSESEKLVQEALNNLMENRTAIVIAHRLSTIQHADEILVLEKGQIIERGSHEDLIRQDGTYKKLVVLQAF